MRKAIRRHNVLNKTHKTSPSVHFSITLEPNASPSLHKMIKPLSIKVPKGKINKKNTSPPLRYSNSGLLKNDRNVLRSSRTKIVFISYSHKEIEYLERIKVHLKPLENSGLIEVWYDQKIGIGRNFEEVIVKTLKKAPVVICLLSADFFASDFIVRNELPIILKAAAEKSKALISVFVKPLQLSVENNLLLYQAINDPKEPLSKFDEHKREEVYVKIVENIENLVKR